MNLMEMMHRATIRARVLGHRFDGIFVDEGGYVATCTRCSLWLAANTENDVPVWGRVLHVRCTGRVLG